MVKNKCDENKNIKDLCVAARRGSLSHAILLELSDTERKGIKLALKIAKSLMCTSSGDVFCGKCGTCFKIDNKCHPDVSIVSLESTYKSIRVEDIRNLKRDVYLAPNESKYRVYIINSGELMNESAQNVILKVLEEPPRGVVFIILCKSEFSLINTVRSRVQVYNVEENKENVFDNVREIAERIINASIAKDEFAIIRESSKMIKNKEIFKNGLIEIKHTSMKLYKSRSIIGLSEKESCKIFSVRGKLVKISELIGEIENLMMKNVNNQLLVCYMCTKLAEI